jgi:hypothetical protein
MWSIMMPRLDRLARIRTCSTAASVNLPVPPAHVPYGIVPEPPARRLEVLLVGDALLEEHALLVRVYDTVGRNADSTISVSAVNPPPDTASPSVAVTAPADAPGGPHRGTGRPDPE